MHKKILHPSAVKKKKKKNGDNDIIERQLWSRRLKRLLRNAGHSRFNRQYTWIDRGDASWRRYKYNSRRYDAIITRFSQHSQLLGQLVGDKPIKGWRGLEMFARSARRIVVTARFVPNTTRIRARACDAPWHGLTDYRRVYLEKYRDNFPTS